MKHSYCQLPCGIPNPSLVQLWVLYLPTGGGSLSALRIGRYHEAISASSSRACIDRVTTRCFAGVITTSVVQVVATTAPHHFFLSWKAFDGSLRNLIFVNELLLLSKMSSLNRSCHDQVFCWGNCGRHHHALAHALQGIVASVSTI